jgi:hypothetical protein
MPQRVARMTRRSDVELAGHDPVLADALQDRDSAEAPRPAATDTAQPSPPQTRSSAPPDARPAAFRFQVQTVPPGWLQGAWDALRRATPARGLGPMRRDTTRGLGPGSADETAADASVAAPGADAAPTFVDIDAHAHAPVSVERASQATFTASRWDVTLPSLRRQRNDRIKVALGVGLMLVLCSLAAFAWWRSSPRASSTTAPLSSAPALSAHGSTHPSPPPAPADESERLSPTATTAAPIADSPTQPLPEQRDQRAVAPRAPVTTARPRSNAPQRTNTAPSGGARPVNSGASSDRDQDQPFF